jgi:flavin-dependent dehydrogenase
VRQRLGLAVLLVEQSTYGEPRLGETLPPPCRVMLERLGVWRAFLAQGHVASEGTVSYWGSEQPGYQDAMYSPWGPGWHLARERFDGMLAEAAREAGVEVRTGTRATEWERGREAGWVLHLEGQGAVEARFVVDATGPRAAFAHSRGARRLTVDKALCFHALVPLRPGHTVDSYTLLEACPEGWWYSARLPGERLVVALVGDGDSLRGLKPHQAAPWQALLPPRTRQRLEQGEAEVVAPEVVPAHVACLDVFHGEDWLAVGDAACRHDALSSQGIHLALRSSLAAAEALERHWRGGPEALSLYAAHLRHTFHQHLSVRQAFYRMERRWPDAPYWKKRHTALPHPGA